MDSSSDVTRWSFGGYERPDPARLCIGGCGFYGTEDKQGMCSKCYTGYFKDTNPTAPIVCDGVQSPKLDAEKDQSLDGDLPVAEKKRLDAEGDIPVAKKKRLDADGDLPVAEKKRCAQCSKKVGLLGFGCRCGGTFCGTHRYPHVHACGFDYKAAGRKAIQKENPVVKAHKIVHF